MTTKTHVGTSPKSAPIAQPRRNCWTCPHSGTRANQCDLLTLDEDADAPVLEWLDAVGLHPGGTVPRESDGCPAWGGVDREPAVLR